MAGTTTNYSLPYPTSTDDVNLFPAVNQTAVETIDAELALRAPKASPTFTGSPSAPTPALGTRSTIIPTTASVLAELENANLARIMGAY